MSSWKEPSSSSLKEMPSPSMVGILRGGGSGVVSSITSAKRTRFSFFRESSVSLAPSVGVSSPESSR